MCRLDYVMGRHDALATEYGREVAKLTLMQEFHLRYFKEQMERAKESAEERFRREYMGEYPVYAEATNRVVIY